MTVSSVDDLRALIREVPDFPKPGIRFYDITTLLKDAGRVPRGDRPHGRRRWATRRSTSWSAWSRADSSSPPRWPTSCGAGFVPVRKLGKLPAETIEVEYELEYGTATLEIHSDAIEKGQRVLIVDDLLATGGTVMGTIELVRRLGGEIAGLSFMVELGRAQWAREARRVRHPRAPDLLTRGADRTDGRRRVPSHPAPARSRTAPRSPHSCGPIACTPRTPWATSTARNRNRVAWAMAYDGAGGATALAMHHEGLVPQPLFLMGDPDGCRAILETSSSRATPTSRPPSCTRRRCATSTSSTRRLAMLRMVVDRETFSRSPARPTGSPLSTSTT